MLSTVHPDETTLMTMEVNRRCLDESLPSADLSLPKMKLPNTSLSKEAYTIINVVAEPEIVNHSIRIYLLGKAYAQKKNINFEDEGLYLAALFHDLGLCPTYRNSSQPFQINSSRALQ